MRGDAAVDALVSAMAAFAPASQSQSAFDPNKTNAATTTLAASWHASQ